MPHYVAYFLDNSGPESEKAIFHIAVKHDLMASYYKGGLPRCLLCKWHVNCCFVGTVQTQ
jgi:hypothetical protein